MSNPWVAKSGSSSLKVVETGGMSDYCKFLDTLENNNLIEPDIEDELVEKELRLFNVIDESAKYTIQLKCERDLLKFGEFLSEEQVEFKISLLSCISDHLNEIQNKRSLLIERICEESKSNDLLIEESQQDNFLKLTQIAQEDRDLYSLLKKSNSIHPQTLESTKRSVSHIESMSEQIHLKCNKILKL